MPPSNMSIQPGKVDPSTGRAIERPPMKQESHPEHNMPSSEHKGSVFPHPQAGDSDYMPRNYDSQGQ